MWPFKLIVICAVFCTVTGKTSTPTEKMGCVTQKAKQRSFVKRFRQQVSARSCSSYSANQKIGAACPSYVWAWRQGTTSDNKCPQVDYAHGKPVKNRMVKLQAKSGKDVPGSEGVFMGYGRRPQGGRYILVLANRPTNDDGTSGIGYNYFNPKKKGRTLLVQKSESFDKKVKDAMQNGKGKATKRKPKQSHRQSVDTHAQRGNIKPPTRPDPAKRTPRTLIRRKHVNHKACENENPFGKCVLKRECTHNEGFIVRNLCGRTKYYCCVPWGGQLARDSCGRNKNGAECRDIRHKNTHCAPGAFVKNRKGWCYHGSKSARFRRCCSKPTNLINESKQKKAQRDRLKDEQDEKNRREKTRVKLRAINKRTLARLKRIDADWKKFLAADGARRRAADLQRSRSKAELKWYDMAFGGLKEVGKSFAEVGQQKWKNLASGRTRDEIFGVVYGTYKLADSKARTLHELYKDKKKRDARKREFFQGAREILQALGTKKTYVLLYKRGKQKVPEFIRDAKARLNEAAKAKPGSAAKRFDASVGFFVSLFVGRGALKMTSLASKGALKQHIKKKMSGFKKWKNMKRSKRTPRRKRNGKKRKHRGGKKKTGRRKKNKKKRKEDGGKNGKCPKKTELCACKRRKKSRGRRGKRKKSGKACPWETRTRCKNSKDLLRELSGPRCQHSLCRRNKPCACKKPKGKGFKCSKSCGSKIPPPFFVYKNGYNPGHSSCSCACAYKDKAGKERWRMKSKCRKISNLRLARSTKRCNMHCPSKKTPCACRNKGGKIGYRGVTCKATCIVKRKPRKRSSRRSGFLELAEELRQRHLQLVQKAVDSTAVTPDDVNNQAIKTRKEGMPKCGCVNAEGDITTNKAYPCCCANAKGKWVRKQEGTCHKHPDPAGSESPIYDEDTSLGVCRSAFQESDILEEDYMNDAEFQAYFRLADRAKRTNHDQAHWTQLRLPSRGAATARAGLRAGGKWFCNTINDNKKGATYSKDKEKLDLASKGGTWAEELREDYNKLKKSKDATAAKLRSVRKKINNVFRRIRKGVDACSTYNLNGENKKNYDGGFNTVVHSEIQSLMYVLHWAKSHQGKALVRIYQDKFPCDGAHMAANGHFNCAGKIVAMMWKINCERHGRDFIKLDLKYAFPSDGQAKSPAVKMSTRQQEATAMWEETGKFQNRNAAEVPGDAGCGLDGWTECFVKQNPIDSPSHQPSGIGMRVGNCKKQLIEVAEVYRKGRSNKIPRSKASLPKCACSTG